MRLVPLAAAVVLIAGCDGSTDPGPAIASGRRLAVGELTVCALTNAGGTDCWGANGTYIEYGSAQTPPTNVPAPIGNGVTLKAISSGGAQFMCGITVDGTGVCWGRGGVGQMGLGTDGSASNIAAPMTNGIKWKQISTGRLIACGIDEGGVAYCWGLNQRGEVGGPTVRDTVREPAAINSTATFRKVSAGWLHACGISTSGDMYCWGSNTEGQLGGGTTDTSAHPVPSLVPGGKKWIDVATSARTTCGLAADSTAWCWGYNPSGQVGDNSIVSRSSPTAVASTLKFAQIEMSSGFGNGGPVVPASGNVAGAWGHTCALTAAGAAWCWGWNAYGQLGDGTKTDRLAPVAVQGSLAFGTLGLGGASSCGMSGNVIRCWGANYYGQLGNGSYTDSPTPVIVGEPFNKP